MPEELPVEVNRERHHAVEVDVDEFEPTGEFVVRLRNHGEGSHVHVGLDGDLAVDGRVIEDNHYVDAGATVEVPVELRTDIRPVSGAVEVATGYGDETERIPTTVTGGDDPVVTATTADGSDDSDDATGLPVPEDALPILGLALVSIGLAALAVAVTDSTVVLVGALFVIATAVGGVGYVLRTD